MTTIPNSWIIAAFIAAIVIILFIPERHRPPWERRRD